MYHNISNHAWWWDDNGRKDGDVTNNGYVLIMPTKQGCDKQQNNNRWLYSRQSDNSSLKLDAKIAHATVQNQQRGEKIRSMLNLNVINTNICSGIIGHRWSCQAFVETMINRWDVLHLLLDVGMFCWLYWNLSAWQDIKCWNNCRWIWL